MYTVRYQKYYNDYRKTQEVAKFSSMKEIADWLFGMVRGEYRKSSLDFVDLDRYRIEDFSVGCSCIKSGDGDWTYYIEQIEKDGAIIYSNGISTNGILYCNEEVKQWLKDCRERKANPQFNFG